jgi:hypothetical protein
MIRVEAGARCDYCMNEERREEETETETNEKRERRVRDSRLRSGWQMGGCERGRTRVDSTDGGCSMGITLLVVGSATMRDDWGSETMIGGTPVDSSLVCRVKLAIEIGGI